MNQDLNSAKALGAFYTDSQVAEFLVSWAIRAKTDRVLDPSYGGGVFLRAASRRIIDLNGAVKTRIFGVEVDRSVHDEISERLRDEFGIEKSNLICSDFFFLESSLIDEMDVVVGNPPFIRYQRFSGEIREMAKRRCLELGVRFTSLASSWAPFLVCACSTLRRGGRLAMVVPAEIAYASYASPLNQFLRDKFARITLLTFEKRMFPSLSEDTYLLLADGYLEGPADFYHRDFPNVGALRYQSFKKDFGIFATQSFDGDGLIQRRMRIGEMHLGPLMRDFYLTMKRSKNVIRLGDVADVGIGYVSGNNDFFHLSPERAKALGLKKRFLRKAVFSGKSFSGIKLTTEDWDRTAPLGASGYLLHVSDENHRDHSLDAYLRHGVSKGVHLGYKCRTRAPWYSVPSVNRADAFLTYMSGAVPRLVSNLTGAVAPNTLHVLRQRPLSDVSSSVLPLLWNTSLARLSAEIEGHHLGGGMLKLEPGEAESVLLGFQDASFVSDDDVLDHADKLARTGGMDKLRRFLDDKILFQNMGISRRDISHINESLSYLMERRQSGKVMQ